MEPLGWVPSSIACTDGQKIGSVLGIVTAFVPRVISVTKDAKKNFFLVIMASEVGGAG